MRFVLALVKLLLYIAACVLLLAASTAVAGWLAWQAILWLIRISKG